MNTPCSLARKFDPRRHACSGCTGAHDRLSRTPCPAECSGPARDPVARPCSSSVPRARVPLAPSPHHRTPPGAGPGYVAPARFGTRVWRGGYLEMWMCFPEASGSSVAPRPRGRLQHCTGRVRGSSSLRLERCVTGPSRAGDQPGAAGAGNSLARAMQLQPWTGASGQHMGAGGANGLACCSGS